VNEEDPERDRATREEEESFSGAKRNTVKEVVERGLAEEKAREEEEERVWWRGREKEEIKRIQ